MYKIRNKLRNNNHQKARIVMEKYGYERRRHFFTKLHARQIITHPNTVKEANRNAHETSDGQRGIEDRDLYYGNSINVNGLFTKVISVRIVVQILFDINS